MDALLILVDVAFYGMVFWNWRRLDKIEDRLNAQGR